MRATMATPQRAGRASYALERKKGRNTDMGAPFPRRLYGRKGSDPAQAHLRSLRGLRGLPNYNHLVIGVKIDLRPKSGPIARDALAGTAALDGRKQFTAEPATDRSQEPRSKQGHHHGDIGLVKKEVQPEL